MKNLLCLLLSVGFCTTAVGQQSYPIFTQNYFNPFLVNPSFITLSERAEVNALFRQQWTGINDGPKTMQLDFQYPVSPRISLGVNVYNDKTVLLNNSGALATFAYRVRLASSHALRFALSGGFVSNQIDLEGVPEVDLMDPVLLNSSDGLDFDGQFGIHYRHRNLMLGFSLLKLVDNRPFSEEVIEREKFDPFKDRTGYLSYNFALGQNFSVLPIAYYRSTFLGYDYVEGALLVNYKDFLTVGGGYRSQMGPHITIRFRVKDFAASYAYDLPANRLGGSTGGTNEIQLKFMFGKVRSSIESIASKDSLRSANQRAVADNEEPQEKEIEQEEPVASQEPPPVVEPPMVVRQEVKAEVAPKVEVQEPDIREDGQSDIPPAKVNSNVTYQLVVGVFRRSVHASRYARELNNEGIGTKVLTSSETDYYYVTVPGYATKEITLDRVLEIRNKTKFKDAWFKAFD